MTDDPGGGPRAVLVAHGLRAKAPFGQNFLADKNLCAKIAALATSPPGGTVVEIGAGLGALTRPLLERAARVVAIERDRDLVPILSEAFQGEIEGGRLELLEADAKRVDYAAKLASGPEPRTLAGNLPYQLTGPLLELAAGLSRVVSRVVFMVQLEVGERLTAKAGDDAYGALTVFLRAAYDVERAFIVRRGAFYPQPGVDSVVVVMTPLEHPVCEETDVFRAVVKGAFGKRRKTLRNAWRGLLGLPQDRIEAAAKAAGIDLEARGETLSVVEFARMASNLERTA